MSSNENNSRLNTELIFGTSPENRRRGRELQHTSVPPTHHDPWTVPNGIPQSHRSNEIQTRRSISPSADNDSDLRPLHHAPSEVPLGAVEQSTAIVRADLLFWAPGVTIGTTINDPFIRRREQMVLGLAYLTFLLQILLIAINVVVLYLTKLQDSPSALSQVIVGGIISFILNAIILRLAVVGVQSPNIYCCCHTCTYLRIYQIIVVVQLVLTLLEVFASLVLVIQGLVLYLFDILISIMFCALYCFSLQNVTRLLFLLGRYYTTHESERFPTRNPGAVVPVAATVVNRPSTSTPVVTCAALPTDGAHTNNDMVIARAV